MESFIAELYKTIPVIVGLLAGIISAIASQFFGHKFSAQRDKKKLILDKAELLMYTLYKHQTWLHNEMNRLVFGQKLPEQPSPMNEAYALQALYFPELSDEFKSITTTLGPITAYHYQNAQKRLANEKDWRENFDENAYGPLYQVYLDAFNKVATKVEKIAEQKTKM